jgi:hypothetical protein
MDPLQLRPKVGCSVAGNWSGPMSGVFLPSSLRVLVVDDCLDTTHSLAVLLKLWGHAVRVAYDSPAAIRAFRKRPPGSVR